MDTPEHWPALPQNPFVRKFVPVVALVAGVGVTLFMAITYDGNPIYLMFGGSLILLALPLLVMDRGRSVRLVVTILTIGAAIGLILYGIVATRGNPTMFVYGPVIMFSIVFAWYAVSRNESKR